MDHPAVRAALDACLATEAEMAAYEAANHDALPFSLHPDEKRLPGETKEARRRDSAQRTFSRFSIGRPAFHTAMDRILIPAYCIVKFH